jgi:hypothetical protein
MERCCRPLSAAKVVFTAMTLCSRYATSPTLLASCDVCARRESRVSSADDPTEMRLRWLVTMPDSPVVDLHRDTEA